MRAVLLSLGKSEADVDIIMNFIDHLEDGSVLVTRRSIELLISYTLSEIRHAPSTVFIESSSDITSENSILCTANVVTSHWLLLPADCIDLEQDIKLKLDPSVQYQVRVATDRRASRNGTGIGGKTYHFDKLRIHPGYADGFWPTSKPVKRYNVAMMHLIESLECTSEVDALRFIEPDQDSIRIFDFEEVPVLSASFRNATKLQFSGVELADKISDCNPDPKDHVRRSSLPEYVCVTGIRAPCTKVDLGSPVFDLHKLRLRDFGPGSKLPFMGFVAHLVDGEGHCDEPDFTSRVLVLNATVVQDWILDQIRSVQQRIKA